MRFLDKLERRIGFIAIPGLIRIVVGFTALVFILAFLNRFDSSRSSTWGASGTEKSGG